MNVVDKFFNLNYDRDFAKKPTVICTILWGDGSVTCGSCSYSSETEAVDAFRSAEDAAMRSSLPKKDFEIEIGDSIKYYEIVNGDITAPMHGTVAFVNPDGTVNASILAPNATVHPRGNLQVFTGLDRLVHPEGNPLTSFVVF